MEETIKYSEVLFSRYNEEDGKVELTDFEKRLYELSKEVIPQTIDKNPLGEFVPPAEYPNFFDINEFGEVYDTNSGLVKFNSIEEIKLSKVGIKQFGYFLNEDCYIEFYARNGEVKAFYAEDNNEYHFDVNINEEMSDHEIKVELINGFSKKFGWVELFMSEKSEINSLLEYGIDYKFWISVIHGDDRRLIEVSREIFDIKNEIFNDDGDWVENKYNLYCDKLINIISEHIDLNNKPVLIETIIPTEKDIQDCTFDSIKIIEPI